MVIFDPVAESYAKALLELTRGKEKETLDTLQDINSIIGKEKAIQNFFYNPVVSRQHKIDVIKKTFSQILPEILLNFLCVLVKNERMNLLHEIETIYRYYYDQILKILPVKVITAIPLDDDLKNKIEETLKDYYKKNVDVSFLVKPEILGGIVIQAEGYEIDDSIATKLKTIYKNLKNIKLAGAVYED